MFWNEASTDWALLQDLTEHLTPTTFHTEPWANPDPGRAQDLHTGACGWNCALFLGTTRRWARGNGSAGGEREASSSVLRLVLTWKSDLTETRARGSTGRCEHCEAGGGRTLPAWKLICEVGAGRFSNVYSREGCPVHTWNPITWKVKTVGSWVQGHSGSHKTIPQK